MEKRWKKCQNTRRNRKQHIYLRKNKKHVDEFSGNMSNFKKQIYAQKKESKKHIYIYILHTKYFYEQKTIFSEKVIFQKKRV